MKTLRIFLSTTAMLVALGGVFAVLAWGQAAAARVEDKGGSPAAPISLPMSYLNSPNAADAPYGITPTLDSRISPGEYGGAIKITFPTYGGQMEVFIIQNAITLYIGIDSPDTTPYPYNSGGGTGPAFQVFLDTHNDKMTTPQVDDYRLTLKKNGSKVEDQGGGGVWDEVPVGNWNGKVSTATWGWQGEYAIRLSKLDITQTVSITKGLGLAEVWTPSWPKDWY